MKIFLASSTESIEDMHHVAGVLEDMKHVPLRWDSPSAFLPGVHPLPRLIEISREVEAAVFIFAEDDKAWYRDAEFRTPRDNILVEYGLFAGTLGPERTLICRKGRPRTPTDLQGFVHIDISAGKEESARARIANWVMLLERRRGSQSHPLFMREFVRVVADNRKVLDPEYRELKYTARNIDVLGMALTGALDELATDGDQVMLKRILFDGAHVRLIFVTPQSEYVRQRAVEDGDSVLQLQVLLKNSVRRVRDVYGRFKRLYDEEEKRCHIRPTSIGSLEIRVIDFCPHFTIYRTDDSILWGIYTASTRGLYSSVLHVQKAQDTLFNQILGHFDSLWKVGVLGGNRDETHLLKCHSGMPPILNEDLVKAILGEE